MYPCSRQIPRFAIPSLHHSGSQRLWPLAPTGHRIARDFHYQAATETLGFMDSLYRTPFFWAHDGAIIAAILGFTASERISV